MQFEKILAHAEQKFANHKAKLMMGGNCTTVLWRCSGTKAYEVKFVLSENNVFIDGDIGSAVVRLTEPATLKALSTYWKRPNYFAEKILCSTDLYVYNYDGAKAELERRYEEILENDGYNDDPNLEEDKERLDAAKALLLEGFTSEEGFSASEEGLYEWSGFDHFADDWIHSAGRELHLRVYLWLLGLKMAYEQLQGKED